MDSAEVLTLKSVYYSQSHGQANMVSERRVPPLCQYPGRLSNLGCKTCHKIADSTYATSISSCQKNASYTTIRQRTPSSH
ncbi:hypothetical protein NW757_012372 [Fusarium falciforme]|nr:hypothetical protein NW757_012372 [Fusarium falciforme]